MYIIFIYPIIFFIMIFGLALIPRYINFKKSNYKIESGNSFFNTVFDKGNYGEFLTFFI